MNKPDSVNEQKQKEDRAKFENVALVSTTALTVKKTTGKKVVDLRTPDDFGKWVKDPDEIREQRKAARRAKAKKKREE